MRSTVQRRIDRETETGASLIEVLVAVAILGIAVTTLLSGMATAVKTSDYHRKQASSETVMVRIAEYVKSQPYVACDLPLSDPATPPYSLPSSLTMPLGIAPPTIDSVQVWNGSAFVATPWWTSAGYNSAGCPNNGDDANLQLVTITVKALDGQAVSTTTVVKRDVS